MDLSVSTSGNRGFLLKQKRAMRTTGLFHVSHFVYNTLIVHFSTVLCCGNVHVMQVVGRIVLAPFFFHSRCHMPTYEDTNETTIYSEDGDGAQCFTGDGGCVR